MRHRGEYRYHLLSPSFVTSEGVGGQRHTPAALPTERIPGPIFGGWMGPRTGLDGTCRRKYPLSGPGFEHRTTQALTSHYTDDDLPASQLKYVPRISYITGKKKN